MTQEIISKKSYIGGAWITGKGKVLHSQNPATGENGETFTEIDQNQVDGTFTTDDVLTH